MSGDDREPIGRKGKPAGRKPARTRPVRRSRRDDDYDEYEEEELDDEYEDEDDYEEERGSRMSRKAPPRKAKKGGKKSLKRRIFWLLVKLFIVFAILLGIYAVYLNREIHSRIDGGKVWQLPAAVYGRQVNLEPDMSISKAEMVGLLEGTQYREVTRITRPGEFTVHANYIDLLRRPFDFPEGKEGQVNARLMFDGNSLSEIKNLDNQRDFGLFRLDPRLITMLQASNANGEQRLFVPRSGFPDLLVDTLLATEDRHFYEHDGINFYSIGRAVVANLTAGHAVQGGSTLTQQLVKNLFLTNERSLSRKAREAVMAVLLDADYSKDRILELYLNEVYLGQSGSDQIRGFPLASLYYFGRPVNELSLDQQALLVGMVKGASLYNPWRNPAMALQRRNLVLRLLVDQKVIDQELYDMLSARPLGVQPKGGVISPQPAFMQMVRQELQAKLGDKVQDMSGVKIFTTLDPISQDAAEKAVEEGIPLLRKKSGLNDIETAMVIVDRYTGEVRAMVGGAETQFAGFNRAMQARRQVGSLAKPATYLTALSQPDKYRLNTILADQPLNLKLANGQIWSPKNDDHQFRGQVLLVDALARSMNVPTVNLGMAVGLDNITKTLIDLGIPKESLNQTPSMLLGAIALTPMEVAQEYQTIASGGNKAPLSAVRSVIAEDGTVLYQSFPQAVRVIPSQAAYLTLYAMQQVVQEGTSRALANKFPKLHLAAKTGTSNELRDSWFAGIDGNQVAITWVGRDNNGPSKLWGSTGALVLYGRYLENGTPQPLDLQMPEGISPMNIDGAGNFVCGGGGGMLGGGTVRSIPVWTDSPDAMCQASVSAVQQQQQQQQIQQQQQQQQQPQGQQPQAQDEKKDSNGVAGWIKDMFGSGQ
ncbi:bifunctional glycosyl transferase/transpeptidase [Rahnella laticis]|uniref:bifunctional glycosyl transferase/transpeptidase n=1 Tax=Rahnella laticis TaxID=2787622 RepID=UPI0018A30773|nr:bifunctional glycosyl transferase/transpeptidase [Rahnella laticis]MBF7994477.1 bifunctional glycosyl transferase/transpeptidase [Rahnella laticis]